MTGDAPDRELAGLKQAWPDAFRDGARFAFVGKSEGERERGGYPRGFFGWSLERRNAWFCGFNVGLLDKQRARTKMEAA
jgi:hypothetical protein